ncbi:Rv3235 family protein [Arthrobacter sp. SX1312]|uniref:Rv3235 family protein n=1 Tax=Arthrobacter sp. SX1312 TaxID=2058896 RepID=UPI000CE3D21F|nr:Rv3235 family protein [Arthrobacter sp. SX1312]
MNAVTHLRPAAPRLAEASGAPRPLLAAPPRPADARATMIPLRSPAEPVSGPGSTPGPLRDEDAAGRAGPEVEYRIAGIARSVCQGALEVLGGSRPLQQMARWLDAENYERLQLRANLVRCIDARPPGRSAAVPESTHRCVVVRSARVCPVSPGVYEAAVVAFDRKRVRAVALRIEQRRGAWRVTALEIG